MAQTRTILSQSYFDRPTLIVARSLVGKYVVRQNGVGVIAGKIVEVEAYIGTEDKACHASKGRTRRTEVLFGPPGISYVYLIYGMYHMLNVVTERVEFPAAVLIRAIEVDGDLIDGPGKLCRELDIDRSLHQIDLTEGRSLWFEDRGVRTVGSQIGTFPRIGVDYAGLWAKKPWRFRLLAADRRANSSRGKHKEKGKSF
ncbi:MAG: DNA-3-methyladenine glycosylase [Nitrospira sp.]|nr:DNA-3-methyladenine glycosylase [Nitrospira sp.]MDH4304044.1 DNA-3-methyladenine glycosylase [Nitrospira sp.]MDH5193826.1 DNA-3-methyladenine glycosylase [Nitrospira sp.]